MKKIQEINPKMLFLAGGTDYGERDTAFHNYEVLMQALPDTPLVYAGNIENHDELKLIAEEEGYRLYLCGERVPLPDQLKHRTARHLIYKVFEEHIIHSPGMEKIRDLVSGTIMPPTPGAVMEAAMLAKEQLGDVLASSTSVVRPPTCTRSPKGRRKFGTFKLSGALRQADRRRRFGLCQPPRPGCPARSGRSKGADPERRLLSGAYERDSDHAGGKGLRHGAHAQARRIALERHAGKFIDLYGPTGRQTLAEGKDLLAIKHGIGTGGALTRLPYGIGILQEALKGVC